VIINITVFITAFLILFSKFLDCYTTAKRINTVEQEMNPIARWLMMRAGIHNAIWTVFFLATGLTSYTLFDIFCGYNERWYKLVFILLGHIISTVQFAVAHHNYYQRRNLITEILHRLYKMK